MNLQEELKALKERIAELEELAKEEREFPQEGHWYWYITSDAGIGMSSWEEFEYQKEQLSIGNIFRTREQAEFALEKLKIEAELRKFSRPFEYGKLNYFLFFDIDVDNFKTDFSRYSSAQGAIYFESKEKAQQAVSTVGVERTKKYIFGVEDQP